MNTEIKPYTQAQKSMIWVSLIAFVLINSFCILIGTLTPFGAERLMMIVEILFWFDLACVAIIGSFFGLDIILTRFSQKP